MVLSAADFLLLDQVNEDLAAGALGAASEGLRAALEDLPKLQRPEFLARAILSRLAGFHEQAGARREREPEQVLPALDALIEQLVSGAQLWLAALPSEPDLPSGEGERPRGIAPRLQGFFLLRRLFKLAERWDALALWMARSRELGVRNEWLDDALVEGLQRGGRAEEALHAVRVARREFAGCESLARREAALLFELGDDQEASEVLRDAALRSRDPWAWRDLARAEYAAGRTEHACDALRCALAWHDPAEPGPVWRLHLELARRAAESGDEATAALEFHLAREARSQAGWGEGSELREFAVANGAWLGSHLVELEARPARDLRRKAIGQYRELWQARMRSIAKSASVVSVRDRFGFLDLDGETENIFFPMSLWPGKPPANGARVLAVVVSSWDARKGRASRSACWIGALTEQRAEKI
ncbi:MAG: hypothetical protein JNM84_12605 [Planctomycetes bacterium]|nr:hypothetical protein [Planctomycetota bacterium]